MEEQDGKKQFNISERLEDLRREHEALDAAVARTASLARAPSNV